MTLMPFVFALAVAHTASADQGDTCPGTGPIEISSSCSKYNCFDGAHIIGYDITCDMGLSEAECAEKCCWQTNCKGFDFTASADVGQHGGDRRQCCTSYVSRVEGSFQQIGGIYRSCEKNSVTCGAPTHISAACREFGYPNHGWQVDEDCCAPYNQSACADGFDHKVTEHKCFEQGNCVAYSTICSPSDDPEKVTMSNDATNYKCDLNPGNAIVLIAVYAVLVPLLGMCGLWRCYLTKTGCFQYRRTEQSSGIAVVQGVQMGYMPTVYAQPTHGWPHYAGTPQHVGQPQYGQPAPPPGCTVHQATVQHADATRVALGQPYTGQGSQGRHGHPGQARKHGR